MVADSLTRQQPTKPGRCRRCIEWQPSLKLSVARWETLHGILRIKGYSTAFFGRPAAGYRPARQTSDSWLALLNV